MFKVTKYPHGTFSWVDCNTTNWKGGKKFYSELMGWETEDVPMGNGMQYTFFKKDGETVAAISPMQKEQQEQGIPSMWYSYITVDDVDALAGKVKELGGTLMGEPFDVFDNGRMVLLQDPTGAVVSLWQPKTHIGATLVNTPGAFTWNELYTRDVPAAKEFYSQLLGWEFEKTEGMEYWVGKVNGRMNCGIMPITEDFGDIPPYWAVYFSVADIEETTKKVKELGGQVHSELMDAGGIGRFSVIADPGGASVIIMQTNNPDPWVE